MKLWPYMVMVYIVMAGRGYLDTFVGMTYVVMAYIVMAYMVMVYIVMAGRDIWIPW